MSTKKKRDPEFERWSNKGKKLEPDGHQWKVADWIREGFDKFGKSRAYDEAEKVTGYTRATLYEFRYTAECFPTTSTRVGKLSFGHHRLVAKKYYTEEQRQSLLQLANGKSVSKFAAILRQKQKTAKHKAEKDRFPSAADRAANRVVEACTLFLRKYDNNIGTLQTSAPSRESCMTLLDSFRKIAMRVSSKIEELENELSKDQSRELENVDQMLADMGEQARAKHAKANAVVAGK